MRGDMMTALGRAVVGEHTLFGHNARGRLGLLPRRQRARRGSRLHAPKHALRHERLTMACGGGVRELIFQVRRWWVARPRRPAAAKPYDVACACGGHARGLRRPRHQVGACPGCGGPVFVLGGSPLAGATAESRAAATPRRYWVGPALAAVLTLAAVVVIFSRLIPALAPAPPADDDVRRDDVCTARQRGREGDAPRGSPPCGRPLRRGAAALRRAPGPAHPRREAPSWPAWSGRRRWSPTCCPSRSARSSTRRRGRAEERQAQFNLRYRNRAVVFDDVVTHDAAGRFDLAVYEVRAPASRRVSS